LIRRVLSKFSWIKTSPTDLDPRVRPLARVRAHSFLLRPHTANFNSTVEITGIELSLEQKLFLLFLLFFTSLATLTLRKHVDQFWPMSPTITTEDLTHSMMLPSLLRLLYNRHRGKSAMLSQALLG
jgi:hypothetical protein